MPYQLDALDLPHPALADPDRLARAVARLIAIDGPAYRRLWAYYRNPTVPAAATDADDAGGGDRPYRQAQEWGLPSRITGSRPGPEPLVGGRRVGGVARKEVVVENDIGWRVDTAVDYLFGRPVVVDSAAPDPARRRVIGELLRLVLAANGGVGFLQQVALIGAVYGFVDVLVKLDPADDAGQGDEYGDGGRMKIGRGGGTGRNGHSVCGTESLGQPPVDSADAADPIAGDVLEGLACHARRIRLEIVEPARALPLLHPGDCSAVAAYAQAYEVGEAGSNERAPVSILGRIFPSLGGGVAAPVSGKTVVLDLLTPTRWQRYEGERLVAEGDNPLGVLPLVHVQNVAQPFTYTGVGEVEPLVALQDELNTRLSDRAHRIALQSFKMYLGRGVEGFLDQPVTPGRMWATDNPDATVAEFGGDAHCPSEEQHVADVREAMDKLSGVSPIAAGAIKGRVGRLTSAAALRVTLLALLARTERKRATYGSAVARLCELSLAWLDRAGLFATAPAERRVEIRWPDPIPANSVERLEEARAKRALGVPEELVLRELGY